MFFFASGDQIRCNPPAGHSWAQSRLFWYQQIVLALWKKTSITAKLLHTSCFCGWLSSRNRLFRRQTSWCSTAGIAPVEILSFPTNIPSVHLWLFRLLSLPWDSQVVLYLVMSKLEARHLFGGRFRQRALKIKHVQLICGSNLLKQQYIKTIAVKGAFWSRPACSCIIGISSFFD